MTDQAYTHAMHAKRCREAAKACEILQQWVQVKTSGSANCARLIDAWSTTDNVDFWKVAGTQPLAFTGSFPVKAVRQCSGLDGRCACAGEAGDRAKLAPHESAGSPAPGLFCEVTSNTSQTAQI